MSPLDEVLQRLPEARRAGQGWITRCPSHEDRRASLSVSEGDDGRVLLHCHAGCSTEDVVERLGLGLRDLYPDLPPSPNDSRPPGRVTDYQIRTPGGEVVAVHRRTDFPEGTKSFSWLRPDGSLGLGGLRAAHLLYGVQALAQHPEWPVVLTEGEKAAEALKGSGLALAAIGTVSGASSTPSHEALAALKGRRVALWPDNDEPGLNHMLKIGGDLEKIGAAELGVVTWPEAPLKADAADFLAGHDSDDLKSLLAGRIPFSQYADSRQPRSSARRHESGLFRTAEEIDADAGEEAIQYLAAPYFAEGTIVNVTGLVKQGKTTLVMALVRAALDGTEFLGEQVSPGPVVYLTEERVSTFRLARERAGIGSHPHLYVLHRHEARDVPWEEVVSQAADLALNVGARLLVVDTVPRWARVADDGENQAGTARAAMEALEVAAARGLCVVATFHSRKSGGGVGEATRGSGEWDGSADVLLLVSKPAGYPETVRQIDAEGRLEVPSKVLVNRCDDGRFSPLGSPAENEGRHVRAWLLETLPPPDGDGLLKTELEGRAAEAGVNRQLLREAVDHLVKQGQVIREGSGRRGSPIRLALNSKIHAATPNLGVGVNTEKPLPGDGDDDEPDAPWLLDLPGVAGGGA